MDSIDIRLLNPDDIISESRKKINYNFARIAAHDDVTDYKLAELTKSFNTEIEKIKDVIDYREIGLLNNMDELGSRINALPSLDNIQNAIDAAVSNAAGDLENFVRVTAGQQISSALVGYARTSEIAAAGYINSAAFSEYKSNAAAKTASLGHIVGNSTFLRDEHNRFIWAESGEPVIINGTGITSIELYYDYLNADEKAEVDGDSTYDNKLEDPDVVYRLKTLCETKFKTVATELASIQMIVGDGVTRTAIVNAIKDTPGAENDGDIIAAIFVEANKDTGSSIQLNANHLNLTGDSLKINTNNFKVNVNGDGKVSVKGAIEATSLKIGSLDLTTEAGAKSFVRAYETPNPSGETEPYDDTWLTNAFSNTIVNGGLMLTGNVFVGNSNGGGITAGMMGYDTASTTDDIRFFAGTRGITASTQPSFMSVVKSAPFRVYENGHVVLNDLVIGEDTGANTRITQNTGTLIAKNAEITGNITANTFSSESGTKSLDSGGTYTVGTYINSEQFLVSSKTTKNNQTNDAKIYITILPELSVSDVEGVPTELVNSAESGKLIGVPVLCFEYKGYQYYMTPGAWKVAGGSGANTSNMYFHQGTTISKSVSFTDNSTFCKYHSDTGVYVFNSYRNIGSGNTNSYVLRRDLGTRYVFGYDFGASSAGEITSLQGILNSYGLTSGKVAVDLPVNQGFVYNSNSKTNITAEKAQLFANKLFSGEIYESIDVGFDGIGYSDLTEDGEVAHKVTYADINQNVISRVNKLFKGYGVWSWESDFDENVSYTSILSDINPFETNNSNYMFGEVRKSVTGAKKVKYNTGVQESLQTVDKDAYGLYEFDFTINYNDSSEFTVTLRNGYNTNQTYKVSEVHINIRYGVYCSGVDNCAEKVVTALNNTTFTNSGDEIGIRAVIYGYNVNDVNNHRPVLRFSNY